MSTPSDDSIAQSQEHLIDLFNRSCGEYPSHIAFHSFGTALSYYELQRRSDAFAHWLIAESELKRGDRVAVMLPNLLQYPIVFFGILKAQMVVTNVNPLYRSIELNHQIKDSGAKAIVIFSRSLETLIEVLPDSDIEQIIITAPGDLLNFPKRMLFNLFDHMTRWRKPGIYRRLRKQKSKISFLNDVLKLGQTLNGQLPSIDQSDTAVLQYTGGTTGLAKGAVLTHRNLVANLTQMRMFFPILDDIQPPTVLTALPMYHIFSLTVNFLLFISIGGTNILIADPRKTPALVKIIKRHRINVITGVDTLFKSLLNHQQFSNLEFSALKLTIGGGMPVQQSTAQAWKKVTGNMILQGYGLTETSPVVCVNPYGEDAFNGSVGLPLPATQLSIRSLEGLDTKELPLNEHGELWIKGPQVMAGYWRQNKETASAMEDGWFKTGDIAYINEAGYVYIVGRKKDLVLVSGFNVYPNEVEDIMSTHEEIIEVACIGVPDSRSGHRIKAFIVKAPQSTLTEAQLIDFCKEKMAMYKVPAHIVFCGSLPKSHVGKVLHRKLK